MREVCPACGLVVNIEDLETHKMECPINVYKDPAQNRAANPEYASKGTIRKVGVHDAKGESVEKRKRPAVSTKAVAQHDALYNLLPPERRETNNRVKDAALDALANQAAAEARRARIPDPFPSLRSEHQNPPGRRKKPGAVTQSTHAARQSIADAEKDRQAA